MAQSWSPETVGTSFLLRGPSLPHLQHGGCVSSVIPQVYHLGRR